MLPRPAVAAAECAAPDLYVPVGGRPGALHFTGSSEESQSRGVVAAAGAGLNVGAFYFPNPTGEKTEQDVAGHHRIISTGVRVRDFLGQYVNPSFWAFDLNAYTFGIIEK